VLPHLQPRGRCIAPDLIGMGDSDKLPDSGPGSYRFVEHRDLARFLRIGSEPISPLSDEIATDLQQ
jgi:pimeloyl-ACP methyl ester carboxylesterase